MPARIFIVEDHSVMREGYRSLLEREPDLAVCGEAGDGLTALDAIETAAPDLVLVDLQIPGLSGLELIKRLRGQYDDLKQLVISAHDETLYAERVMRAGAHGYIMKHEAADLVIGAIRDVLDGRTYLSPQVRDLFAQRYIGSDESAASLFDQLTDRELEVFEAFGRGLSTREVAERLHISPKTVETYRGNIKQKLGIEHTTELIHRAVVWVESKLI